MQIIGLDLANGFIKVRSGNIEETYENRLRKLNGSEFNILGQIETIYDYNGEKYTINSKGNSSGGRNRKRYSTKEYKIESLIAISKVITQQQITLVMGLPSEDYKDEQIKNQVRNNLIGRHVLYVAHDETETIVIDVKDVLVIPQPLGSLIDIVYDDSLKVINDRNEYKYAIIDIGYGTTDILCTDGLRAEKVVGGDLGCVDITNSYLDYINKQYEGTDYRFTREDVTLHNKSTIKKYGREFDFTQQLKDAKQDLVDKVKTFINDSGINLSDYDRILFTGGGSLAVSEFLPKLSNSVIYNDGQMANANGFYKFGRIKKGTK